MAEIPTQYDPSGIEDRWNDFWQKEKLCTPDLKSKKKAYTIVIPPPNVTGRLTLGHVLNNTVQDVLIRYKKLAGFETLWVPGMDHAGIATQVVVEERLLKENKTREELGREKFVEEVWRWKEEYADAIRSQLKKMGCALDWSRECFTLSDDYSKKVIKVFVELYNKKLIYRGERIINWCPRCLTALSDEQVETEEKMDRLYYVRYPIKGTSEYMTVATTRPETMLGDTALCVNPRDKRYKKLIGKKVILPIMEREIPVIADDYVDPEFGTGALKVTPAHDPFDFDLAKKHGLAFINIMNPDGTLNENAKEFNKMERFAARKRIIEVLKDTGLLDKIENYKVPLSTCERCHTAIEPRLSKQWFVKMKPLAEPALQVVKKGKVKIYPKRWINLYNHWLENVRDWCISRQLWWGHRIPIYYCKKCAEKNRSESRDQKSCLISHLRHGTETNTDPPISVADKIPNSTEYTGIFVAESKPERCPDCGSGDIHQDKDVLDTWFSSWLWPFATLGWPEETNDYRRFYPTQTLATGWDIIYLWVARMIMAGLEFTRSIPFSDVVFHPMIRDEKGRKMSKSLGNSPEPMDLIEKYGADALRFGILLITPREQDVLFTEKSIEVGRKFCNKLWNAARLIWMNFNDQSEEMPAKPTVYDTWLLAEMNRLVKDTKRDYDNFEINNIAKRLYDFVWHTFCDWYLEFIKHPPHDKANAGKYFLKQILIMLHPFMPFITEELYQRFSLKKKSILIEELPGEITRIRSSELVDRLVKMITEIRNVRGIFSINQKESLDISIMTDNVFGSFLKDNVAVLQRLASVKNVIFNGKPCGPAATVVMPDIQVYVAMAGIDTEKEKTRLRKEIEFLKQRITEIDKRLKNPQYVKGASSETRQKEEQRLQEFKSKKEFIRKAIENL